MEANSSDIIIKAIKDCFDVEKSDVTRDQSLELQKFLNSNNNTALIVEKDDDSSNQLAFKTKNITSSGNGYNWRETDKTLVFVKYSKVDDITDDVIINESEIISRLRNVLQRCDGSSSSVMHALSDLRQAEQMQQVLHALNAERKDLLSKVIVWAENCGIIDDSNNRETIDKIGVLKAREGKLKAVARVCETLFKDLPNFVESKQVLEQVYKEISDECQRLLREWYLNFKDIKLDNKKQCIEIDTRSQIPKVTFDPKLVKLSQEARILRCLGFHLPSDIALVEDDVNKYGVIARELREIVNFYCSVADQILLSQRPMLIDAAKRFTALLESRDRMSWDSDTNKITVWVEQLKTFSKRFSDENRTLRKHHNRVLMLIKALFELHTLKWRANINEVKAIMQEIDLRYQNTIGWKKHWDYQLYKILEYHFNDALIKSNNLLSFDRNTNSSNHFYPYLKVQSTNVVSDTFKIDLCFVSGFVAFKPPLEEIKSKIYSKIKNFLMTPKNFQGFMPLMHSSSQDKNTESIFYAIYLRNFNNFSILYEKADEIIEELLQIKQKFVDWCSLYYLIKWQNNTDNSSTSLSHFLGCHTLDDYKNNLLLIKSKAQLFNRDFIENEIVCESGNFVVNIVPIKTFVDWLLIEIDKLLAKCLKEKCVFDIKYIHDKCNHILQTLSNRPQNINELMQIDDLLKNELNVLIIDLKANYINLENKLSFLMKWSAKIAPDISEVKAKYDEFERLCETKDSLLGSYREILKSKASSELGNTSEEIEVFANRWQTIRTDMKESKEVISEMRIECDLLAVKCEELSASCDYFSITKPKNFDTFMSITEEVRDSDAKWNLIHQFEDGINQYLDMEWIVSRNKLNSIESYIIKWEEENSNIGSMLVNKMKEWRELLSILKICRGECYSRNHWQQFLSMIGVTSDYEKLKLSQLVLAKKQLLICKEEIKDLNIKAANEMSINETFKELDSFAENSTFVLYSHQTSQGMEVQLIKDWRLVFSQVSESILTLQSLKNSEFFTNDFAERCQLWESRLNDLDSMLCLLNGVQRKWIALEPIYSKDDSEMFSNYSFSPVSRDYLDILKIIHSNPHVIRLLNITGLETRLKTIDQTLINCQKKLQAFMEESRARFARFYFLADDDLLLILAGKVQLSQTSLLKKLFNNAIIKLNIDNNLINSVESPEGEVLNLRKKVIIDSDRGAAGVETWLRSLEIELKASLKCLFYETLSENRTTITSNMWQLPSQLISVIQWVAFTQRIEDSIRDRNLEHLKSEYSKHLGSLTTKEVSIENIVLNIKVKSLVLDTIHFLSVIEELIANNIRDIEDWVWQKQLRYYANKHKSDGELLIKMGNAVFEYSFEYLGCLGGAKLVHTPLTDKCYLTLTQAMEMGLGGNPYGPAGTGKTESVKALAQHLGRLVLVFNCDEAIDVKAMTRILVGLIKCGAWGCFDEFNRLQVHVLSALSSQIQAIQLALKTHSKTVLLPEYGEVHINSNTAIFITLNPAGKQYGGRNRLPDNLKSLFLPVAMSTPDNAIISRVLLLAEGFSLNMSEKLGEKITTWFELAKDCMTYQKHYDWGLRAIKTCLESSGRALKLVENKDEIKIFVSTLYKQIKSKLINEDEHKFEALICDVFGENDCNINNDIHNNLRKAVIKVLEDKELIVDEGQVTKIMEFDEQLKSRLGVVILGQSGSGKSTLWKVLKEAHKLNKNCHINTLIINPKAITRCQLLGYVDEDTREWHDGVITCKSREIARDESDTRFWIVFDGDIDPDWVEALNSVLDDNKVLTLPSGERIDFDAERCNLIFETTSLTFASPATISRLGVVCINGNKGNQLISSQLKQFDAHISMDEILRYVSSFGEDLCVSVSRTVLSHIKFAKQNDSDPIQGMLRVLAKSTSKLNQRSGLSY